MPQLQLPFFPYGATEINVNLAILREGDTVTYIYGHLPIFTHDVRDTRTFRMIISQLYLNGREIRFEERYVTKGRKSRSSACSVKKKDGVVNKEVLSLPSTKSDRSIEDGSAPMGMGATNTLERMAASVGQLNAVEPSFVASLDVPNAGVLFALPALLVSGLLRHAGKYFQLPQGYYRLDSIFLLLGFMALSRIKKVEDLRYCPPGEWGKMLGLDRIPEVKTLREKIGLLSNNDKPSEWASA